MKQYLFNHVLSLFTDHKIKNKTIILAISGGLDSVVLLDILKKISKPCNLKLFILHIHHGKSIKKHIQTYRDNTEKFVTKLAAFYQLEFLCAKNITDNLQSEQDFRNFRHIHFKKTFIQKKAHSIALAHNKNDSLETKLIQLIRGCGKEGVKGMCFFKPPFLRPLLSFSRPEIQTYAKQQNLKWKEDPSNKKNHYLRNWIRNKWLPLLEQKRPGTIKSLERSLELLSLPDKNTFKEAITSKGIKRSKLLEMPFKDQKTVLALYMQKQKILHYGQSHITEILKHANRVEKEFSLKILKKTWTFTKYHIITK